MPPRVLLVRETLPNQLGLASVRRNDPDVVRFNSTLKVHTLGDKRHAGASENSHASVDTGWLSIDTHITRGCYIMRACLFPAF